MALARSASGPGGLSINTGAANLFGTSTSQAPAGGSLFGASTSQPAQSAGLFGSTSNQPQQQGSLFGGTQSASATQPQTGGLFGQQQQQSQQQPAGGLFGQQQPQQQTGGLFGQQQQQQQPSGGLFGQQQQQPQQTATGGGLFGQASTQKPALGGSLFGGSTAAQPQQTSTGGLFGQSTQQQQTGGLFGQSTTQQQTQGSSLFGQPRPSLNLFGTSQPQASTFGSSLTQQPQQPQQPSGILGPGLTMGQSGTSQQSTVPGVRIDLSQIKGTTRFNDLQEDLQKELTALDGLIRRCMEQKSEIDAFLPAHGEQVAAVGNDVAYLADKHRAVEHALEDDLLAVSAARNVANRDADAARLAFAAVDVLRLPAQYHHHVVPGSKVAKAGDTTTGPVGAVASALDSLDFGTAAPAGGAGAGDTKETSGPSSIVDFFAAATSELSAALSRHEALLADVEARMRGLEADALAASTSGLGVPRVADEGNGGVPGTADGGRLSLADVVQLLRETEEVMVDVAGKVLGVREAVAQLPPAPAAGTARAYQGAAGSGRYGGRR